MEFTHEQISEIISSITSGKEGLQGLVKMGMESLMKSEREIHNEQTADVRNGFRDRRICHNGKMFEIKVPRSRENNFYPMLLGVLKDQKAEVQRLICSLYSQGLTTSQVGKISEEFYGMHYSKGQVSRLLNGAREDVGLWLKRGLEYRYPIIYIDATYVLTRRDSSVSNEAYYTVLEVREDRTREVLDIVNFPTKSSINQDFDVSITITGEDLERKVVATAKAINGHFYFELEPVKTPVMAILYFLGSGHGIILENADILSGGYYNEILYSWERIDETKKINGEIYKNNKNTNFKNISDDSIRTLRDEQSIMRNHLQKIKADHLTSLKSNNDPYIKLFAVLESGRISDKDMELLKELDVVLQSNPEIQKIFKNAEIEKKRSEIERSVAVGRNLIDFESFSLGGHKMKLSATVKKNRYTLLEIWASWCAPCRNDIKKLPPIYSKYKDLGFEIFAVSLDEKKDQWEKASAEMSMPWINTHFISGTKDDVGELYGIKSIPKNILFDIEGKIVAVDIKGEKLEKFLQEKF